MAHGKWRMVNGSGGLTLAVAPIGDLQLGVVGAAGALAQLALGVVGASVGAANRIRVLLMLLLLLLLLLLVDKTIWPRGVGNGQWMISAGGQ